MGLGFEVSLGVVSVSVEGEESLKYKSVLLFGVWEIDFLNLLY